MEGIDISEDAIAYARQHLGVEARSAEFLTDHFLVPPDLICLWDTIEHLSRPDLYLQKIADSLPRKGLLALTTGDLDSCKRPSSFEDDVPRDDSEWWQEMIIQ